MYFVESLGYDSKQICKKILQITYLLKRSSH